MMYVLYNPCNKRYFAWKNNDIQWVSSKDQAKQFKGTFHIQEFLKSPIGPYCKKNQIPIPKLKSIPLEDIPSAPAAVPAQTPEAESENTAQNAENTKQCSEPSASPPDRDGKMSMEELKDCLSNISSSIMPLLALYGQVDIAIQRCEQILQEADLEILDLLHKCEFANPNAADGYKIFREIRQCRLRRRDAKDMLRLLAIIKESNVTDVVCQFGQQFDAYQSFMKNRIYQPRVRKDLFSESPEHYSPVRNVKTNETV